MDSVWLRVKIFIVFAVTLIVFNIIHVYADPIPIPTVQYEFVSDNTTQVR